MPLTQAQKTLIQKARSAGGGELGAGLTDDACAMLVAIIVRDLDLSRNFPDLPADCPQFFDEPDPRNLVLPGHDFLGLLDRLIQRIPDADTYFACLASLHKARLKYARILEHQPVPTMDQVGPRALLQYGQMTPRSLAAFLLWRKWLFDIDNRAGQETGYLFEPIVASAIGGASFSASKSPIRRVKDRNKGRQVDCIRGDLAYEIKIRVTIAASGQGRWQEELEFPQDCRDSGYTPVLVVFDPTPNPKLSELTKAFEEQGGTSFVGDAAWGHLEEVAGQTMTVFLRKYVRQPVTDVLTSSPETLPNLRLSMTENALVLSVEEETVEYVRHILEPQE